VLLTVALVLDLAGCAAADEFRAGDVAVVAPWARASAGRTATGVVYVGLSNLGDESEQLISVATPVAAEAAVHETSREHGMMSMRPLKSVELPANEIIRLEPGGLHIMLTHLSSPLVEGETFPMTLTFRRAGTIGIQVEVRGVGAMGDHEHE
jgi:copper(I)-binding protein